MYVHSYLYMYMNSVSIYFFLIWVTNIELFFMSERCTSEQRVCGGVSAESFAQCGCRPECEHATAM